MRGARGYAFPQVVSFYVAMFFHYSSAWWKLPAQHFSSQQKPVAACTIVGTEFVLEMAVTTDAYWAVAAYTYIIPFFLLKAIFSVFYSVLSDPATSERGLCRTLPQHDVKILSLKERLHIHHFTVS